MLLTVAHLPADPPTHAARFMANLVMTQYIEQGPVLLANLVQLIPSFNL